MRTEMPGCRVEARLVAGDHAVGGTGPGTQGRTPRWTPVHTEAARFVGECTGAGAVLGMVAAMRRPRAGD